MDKAEFELQLMDPLFPLRFIQEVYEMNGGEGKVRMHQSGLFSAKSPEAFNIAVLMWQSTYDYYCETKR
jgi:hypothetical protein